MSQPIQEFVDSRGESLRLDRGAGVLRGVKLLGLRSRNGREYRESALADAASLYEGAKVNVNHAKSGGTTPRDYQDRLGAIRQVVFRAGEGLFGDLHFNPKHQLSEQLMWDAEHAPEQVGLSHNVLARTSQNGPTTVVEEITRVESVDLVADPATTRGLFEHDESAIRQQLKRSEAALSEAQQRIHRLERELRIYDLLAEHGLPLPGSSNPADRATTSDAFVATLAEATDDELLERLIVDRKRAVGSRRSLQPTSREQHAGEFTEAFSTIGSAKEFAAAVSR